MNPKDFFRLVSVDITNDLVRKEARISVQSAQKFSQPSGNIV